MSDVLQIGDFDYKPLAIPEAIRLRENFLKEKNVAPYNLSQENNSAYQTLLPTQKNKVSPSAQIIKREGFSLENETNNDIISRVVQTSLISDNTAKRANFTENKAKHIVPTSPIPFYAGWDESLRKFVVTNRLLSRRDSGYEMRMQQERQKDFKILLNQAPSQNLLSFTAAPLKGMNAATTLYWQIPFTTYDPDQFFALGMDGFAPLGWRRFQFRHSILKSWLYEKTISHKRGAIKNSLNTSNTYVVKNKTNILYNSLITNKTNKMSSTNYSHPQLLYKLKEKNNTINNPPFLESNNKFSKPETLNKNTRNIYRRLKKRYRRVKKHPRSPVWFPSGPLLNQVLPVHYIYIFYKRSRLPRDRYIKRRLRKSKTTETLQLNNENTKRTQSLDFTLRKRIKTKRKYHIKRDLTKKSPIIPRRIKFIGEDSTTMRWRPLSRQKLNKPIAELIKEQRALKYKQRKKEQQDVNNKQPANLRIKQLRRRVQRQIIRSVWRYRPRAGGFVWPGDYLKLELVKAPKLNTKNSNNLNTQTKENNLAKASGPIKVKRKKKRTIQEWQIQPKKYLLQKHNLNVIKKKLEKAQRSNKIRERVKELNLRI